MTQSPSFKATDVQQPASQFVVNSQPPRVDREVGGQRAGSLASAPDAYAQSGAQTPPPAQSPLRGPTVTPSAPSSVDPKPPAMPAALGPQVPKDRLLNRSDFQLPQVRAAVAQALARGPAAEGLKFIASDEPPIVIPDLRTRARNVAAHQEGSGGAARLVIDSAQLEATIDFLCREIQRASRGLKAYAVFNGYPAALSFTNDGALVRSLDMGKDPDWHEWFAPMARLGYTARLSHEQLWEMAEVYKKALLKDESATLNDADHRGLALYEYALNLLYTFYHVDLSYRGADGSPTPEPEARCLLAAAQEVLGRARENQRRLMGTIPALDLPNADAVRLA